MRAAVLSQYRGEERGAVTVEFALMLPLMLVLFMTTIEVPAAFYAKSATTNAASALGDLTAQFDEVDDADIRMVFQASSRMLKSSTGVSDMTGRISSLLTCMCREGGRDKPCFYVKWSHSFDRGRVSSGLRPGTKTDIAPHMLVTREGDAVIVAEASATYRPVSKFALSDVSLTFSETMYFRSRRANEVSHVGSQQAQADRVTCP